MKLLEGVQGGYHFRRKAWEGEGGGGALPKLSKNTTVYQPCRYIFSCSMVVIFTNDLLYIFAQKGEEEGGRRDHKIIMGHEANSKILSQWIAGIILFLQRGVAIL